MPSKHAGPMMEELLQCLAHGARTELFVSAESRRPGTPEFLNVYGVCLLRSGRVYEALTVFNEIALDPATLRVRRDVPDSFRTNLATARLLARNPLGCLKAMRRVRDRKGTYYRRLRKAVRDWSRSLPLLRRVAWRLGIWPGTPIPLGFLPGDLDGNRSDWDGRRKEA